MATLNEINERLPRVQIKGKDYVEVDQRVLAFREMYPDGRIVTQLLSDDGARCVFVANVYDDDSLLATGHAFEDRNSGYINKTSYLENAETSAVGRALGFLGIGVIGSIASADEVKNAIEQQETLSKARNQQRQNREPQNDLERAQLQLVAAEKQYCAANGVDDWGAFHRESIMTRDDYSNDVETLARIAAELIEAS